MRSWAGNAGAIIGWTVVSTAWISDGVAGLLTSRLGPPPQTHAPEVVLNAARTLALFLAYDLGFFVDHTLKHRIPALWELHKAHHSAEVLTPLVNFRVHPLNSLILANNLSLFIGVIGGAAQYALGRKAVSFALFDENVLMLLYIYLTAQLQHTQIWIPFTGVWGRVFMSPAHHQLHHSANPVHFNCNMGASLAIWDWLVGSLRMPPVEAPRLAYGASATRTTRMASWAWSSTRRSKPSPRSLGSVVRRRPCVRLARSLRGHRNVRSRPRPDLKPPVIRTRLQVARACRSTPGLNLKKCGMVFGAGRRGVDATSPKPAWIVRLTASLEGTPSSSARCSRDRQVVIGRKRRAHVCRHSIGRVLISRYQVEWRGGISPPRSLRTGREPLSSSGSQHPAVSHGESASARRALGWS